LAAGRCYAYGEPDASVFHSMRALEPCLISLAEKFSIPYSGDGWRNYTMHLRENYNDRDAKDIMENVERVLHYASDRLSENDDEPASLRGETEEDPKRLSRGDEEKA
jgi:hypothetical protein